MIMHNMKKVYLSILFKNMVEYDVGGHNLNDDQVGDQRRHHVATNIIMTIMAIIMMTRWATHQMDLSKACQEMSIASRMRIPWVRRGFAKICVCL